MTIGEIVTILGAEVLCGADKLDQEITAAFGTDMMSDALAFMHERTLLITGMVNTHVIRTAEMLDVRCVLFARGKPVPAEILDMGNQQGMVLLGTPKTLYVSCGMLYEAGMPGCTRS